MLAGQCSLPVSYTHLDVYKRQHLIRFITDVDFSDPSYHLPHFYELFALWAKEEDRAFFKEEIGRAHV